MLLPTSASFKNLIRHDYTPQEIYKTSLSCVEAVLLHLEQEENFNIHLTYLESTGKYLIKFLFDFKQENIQDNDYMLINMLALNSLKFICQGHHDFIKEHIEELIGISRSFIMFGLNEVTFQSPVKVVSSQQALMEPSHPPHIDKQTPRTKKTAKAKTYKKSDKTENSNQLSQFFAYRTSDSDFSDSEHSRERICRNKLVKLRMSALTLLYVTVSETDARTVFGYWHCLLSTNSLSNVSLGQALLKESSPRCRIVILQTISQFLKAAKPFLSRAENKDKVTMSFTPFSVTLGDMIVFNYEILTNALTKEGDYTALTQVLKCLSVFISVTPFHRLKTGIVTGFIRYVRILLRHKDPTIKVAALILVKNLISLHLEMTPGR